MKRKKRAAKKPAKAKVKKAAPKKVEEKTKQRKRTEDRAIKMVDGEIKLTPHQRVKMVKALRAAKSPLVEAKAFIRKEKLKALDMDLGKGHKLDNSDVQELRVKLLRRDFFLDSYQERALDDLDRRVAARQITKRQFQNEATELFHVENTLPARFRKEEREFQLSF